MIGLFESLEDYGTDTIPEIYPYTSILTTSESDALETEKSAHFLICEDPNCIVCGGFDIEDYASKERGKYD